MKFDDLGHLQLKFVYSFKKKLQLVMAKNDKVVCDTTVFRRQKSTSKMFDGSWVAIDTLEVKSLNSGCFICDEHIVLSLITQAKITVFLATND